MKISFNPRDLSNKNKEDIKSNVLMLNSEGINPTMDVILVWDNDSARVYAETKKRIWEILWINVIINSFPANSSELDIIDLIKNINFDVNRHWVMIESPVPEWIDYDKLLSNVSPLKDIDWLHPNNLWNILINNNSWLLPATPLACIDILDELVDKIEWLKITVVWHWRTVWWPLSTLLSNMWATVNTCTHHTKDLKAECLLADVIITATWVKNLIKEDMVTENTIVIDAWISLNSEWKVIWDTDYVSVSNIAKYVSPVPWGVWVVTTSLIFKNLLKWIELQKEGNDLFDVSLNDFIDLSKWPWMPWWWWLSAITAINAISMISMVYSLTKGIDKVVYEFKINTIINKLKSLYNQDIISFNKYLNAIKLSKWSDEEKEYRSSIIQESLIECSNIPLEIAELCLDILEISEDCYRVWNKNVITDVLVWINLAIASWKSALEPIEMNLQSIKNQEYINDILIKKAEILKKFSEFSL